MHDARQVADLVRDLRLIAEVGDEHDVARLTKSSALEPEKPVR